MGKKSAPPPPPDYAAIASQQADINKKTANEQTVTNRPDQNTPWGQTQWSQGPDGSWTQNVSLNPEDQTLLDNSRYLQGTQQGVASDLMGNIDDTLKTPVSLDGLPQIQGFDLSKLPQFGDPNQIRQGAGDQGQLDLSQLPQLQDAGFGSVQEVSDAMMGRMAPQRAQARESEIQRLKNQGLTEGSEAFQRAMTRLDQGDTDAQQQSLLAGTKAYGDIFGRELAARQQGLGEQQSVADLRNQNRNTTVNENSQIQAMLSALRGQQVNEQQAVSNFTGQQRQQSLSEQKMVRDAPLDDYLRLVAGTTPSSPNMPSFMGGTAYQGADMAGAADKTYAAQVAAAQASAAKSSGLTSGLFGLAGSVMGGPIGGMIGKSIGGAIGGGGPM